MLNSTAMRRFATFVSRGKPRRAITFPLHLCTIPRVPTTKHSSDAQLLYSLTVSFNDSEDQSQFNLRYQKNLNVFDAVGKHYA